MSFDPLSKIIGLEGYATDTNGIGGVLKSRTTDFRVEEISTPLHLDPRGRFTVARITLTNWETNRFCTNLARILSIPRNRIFFAGTKDKRAVTQQLFVIDANQNKVSQVEMPDVEIEILGRTHQKIGFGNHRGNRFTIVARGCSHSDGTPMTEQEAMAEVERIKAKLDQNVGKDLFPNWIGPQRFGSGRPVTAEVGRHIIADRWEDAVMTYLSMKGITENTDVENFRKFIRENGPIEEALEIIPKWLGFEKRMLEQIIRQPEDWVAAIKKLPNNLQLMTIHALQSVVFNKSLNARISANLPISVPVAGDLVGRIDEKGQLDAGSCIVVEDRTLPRIKRNCELGRLTPTGPLPGSEISSCDGISGEIEKTVIKDMELEDANWFIEKIPRLSTKGTRRALVTSYGDFHVDTVPIVNDDTLGEKWKKGPSENSRWNPEGACIRFRFTLSSGSYATTLLREFMQCPLEQL
ncbi:MAG: tRNA pseudouridine(13) synthase TruD [Euryarchaeota archaeon]|nr:tRNA pseudouridine(13) synthase TruD [Euryarchaeota archaeon]